MNQPKDISPEGAPHESTEGLSAAPVEPEPGALLNLSDVRDTTLDTPLPVFYSSESVGEGAQAPVGKALNDPRLQELFTATIHGAMAFGFQGISHPPHGHWLTSSWELGRAEAEALEAAKGASGNDAKASRPDKKTEPAAAPVELTDEQMEQWLFVQGLNSRAMYGDRIGKFCEWVEGVLAAARPRPEGMQPPSDGAPQKLEDRVLGVVLEQPSNCYEVAEDLGISMETASAVLSELFASGLIEQRVKTKPNGAGNLCWTYAARAPSK